MARVVFLHPDLGIGGAERLVVDGALALQTKGHQVQKALGTGCGGQSGGSGSDRIVRIRSKKLIGSATLLTCKTTGTHGILFWPVLF